MANPREEPPTPNNANRRLPARRPAPLVRRDATRIARTDQTPVRGPDEYKDAVVRQALERADRVIAMVDKMQEGIPRDRRRDAIERAIAERRTQHRQLSSSLMVLFFANFVVLGLLVYDAGGLVFSTNSSIVNAFDASERHRDYLGNGLLSLARVSGLAGTYLLLVQLLLVSRVPWLDRVYGLDRLTRWHKLNGHISFDLILLHAFAAVAGRAVLTDRSFDTVLSDLMSFSSTIMLAVVGTAMMMLAIVTSARQARRNLGFRGWKFFHLWTYVGVVISFAHQLYGPDFEFRPFSQGYLWLLYGLTFATIGFYRLFVPARNAFRHQLKVSKVVSEGAGVTSVYMTGYGLETVRAQAGQFFYWRFLTKEDWRESHPFSLSMAPNGKYLRITVKSLGDFSSRMDQMPIGTWVTFEGPFGGFTPDTRTRFRTVLIAGGVGITPIRSLLEGLPSAPGDITVIYRATDLEDAVLLTELEELASRREAILHIVMGDRREFPRDNQPLSAWHLKSLVPDIARRDVYICGAPGFTSMLRGTLRTMGLRDQQVHHETFD